MMIDLFYIGFIFLISDRFVLNSPIKEHASHPAGSQLSRKAYFLLIAKHSFYQ